MSYLIGVPERHMSGVAVMMHDNYCMDGTYNPLHYMPCLMMTCSHCYEDLYKACPGCGGRLMPPGGPRECSCGTVLWVCYRGCVQAFATPNPLFKMEEDVI